MSERFSPEVAQVLRDHGWFEGRRVEEPTSQAVQIVCGYVGRAGERHQPFPAVVEALNEFGGLYVTQDGPGRDLARRPFAIDPTLAAATPETLADFGRVIGARLFPLGIEGDYQAILAVDEHGRVFSLDHAGEWHLGDSVAEALTTLVTGRQPARVRDDGTW
ncbi:hypothetical protein LI90_877 [Carbonactinospora thermoautotrophica]|uniref:SUKH-3 domain containing protein n=1 Tax=Carbonactinospora thermoautotrophica TaxID=1469144 RepID=A0A132MN71_9ACTN|nr:SUKH-3 domain-containing protein [Carbonactinospora thermoautotrophica]KWW99243.1 hypothetical protein LI90_877 [Carbonactinospora thermoautotrophica]